MRIGIATPYLMFNADAIGIDVVSMQSLLRDAGHEIRLFTGAPQNGTFGTTESIAAAQTFLRESGDLLIYHHSTGWPEGVAVLDALRCRRVVRYHSVTPPHFFRGLLPAYETACEEGISETRRIARMGCDLYLADSRYNRDDLVVQGAAPQACAVVPPFNQTDRLAQHDIDPEFARSIQTGDLLFLNVGRLAPNKGHDTLIRAFAAFRRKREPRSRLLVIGLAHPEFAPYVESLHSLARELEVAGAVRFAGLVSEEALKTAYLNADVFAMPSLHEGFCVPVVEAMSAKVPIVSSSAAALAETVADCGLLCPPGDAAAMAAAFEALLGDGALASRLTMRGLDRFRSAYSPASIGRRFGEALRKLIQ